MNKVFLMGNLGADPELKGSDEKPVLRIRLATTDSYFDKRTNERKEITDWHSVVVFGNRATALSKILTKGSTILVEGKVKTSSYEKDGQRVWKTEINADNIELAGSRNKSESTRSEKAGSFMTNPSSFDTDDGDRSSIPF